MAEPGHCAAIMNPYWNEAGVGEPTSQFWVLDFGTAR
jgi:uncharacterized protein YkwD